MSARPFMRSHHREIQKRCPLRPHLFMTRAAFCEGRRIMEERGGFSEPENQNMCCQGGHMVRSGNQEVSHFGTRGQLIPAVRCRPWECFVCVFRVSANSIFKCFGFFTEPILSLVSPAFHVNPLSPPPHPPPPAPHACAPSGPGRSAASPKRDMQWS